MGISVKNKFASLFLFIGISVFAQSPVFKFSRIDNSSGLSNNQVSAIFKDSKGFMWFGTFSGLNRYDGYSFKVFKHNLHDSASLSDNYISGISEDHNGKLWISTRTGLNIYDPSSESFRRDIRKYLKENNVPFNSVQNIYKDKSGAVWFLNQNEGFARFTKDNLLPLLIKHNKADSMSISSGQLSSIIEDNSGYYWIMHRDGILEKFDCKTNRVIIRDYSLYHKNGNSSSNYILFVDSDNDLWIINSSVTDGIYYFNTLLKKYRHIDENSKGPALNTDIVRAVTQDNSGNIWIATDHGGVNIINKKTFNVNYLLNNPDDENSISQNSVTSLYKDDNGIIWLGTYKKGVNFYHENLFRFGLYKHQERLQNSLSFDDENCFVEDEKGNLWIGTNGGGLIYYDRKQETFKQYLHNPSDPQSISNNVIVSLCIDHKKQLWIGTFMGGLNRFDNGLFKHYTNNPSDINTISHNSVWKILEDNKKRLWIGTLGGGLDLFIPEKNQFIHYNINGPNKIDDNFILNLLQDKEGNIWIGTSFGVNVLDKDSLKVKQHFLHNENGKQSLSNNNIICMLEDSRGFIWIGTREGLCSCNKGNGTFTIFREEDGLCNNTINSLVEDITGNLWIGTPNGLSNLIITQRPGNKRFTYLFKNYYESDGLQSKEFNTNAAYCTKKGELIFGGPYGFNIFQPEEIKVNMNLPKVVFTDFSVFNKSLKVNEILDGRVILQKSLLETSCITLKHKENVFALEFAALSYFQPEKNRFAYKLEGFNSDWVIIDSKSRKVTYTNLDPGEYVFKVKASNNDGFWNEEPINMKIVVLPPFWRTKIAFLIYFITLFLILYISRRMLLERARMRFNLEHERQESDRRHELDLLKIKFFTNISHEFRTPLTLIITPLEKLIRNTKESELNRQYIMINRNAKRLLNLVNQLLDFRRMEVQEFHLHPQKADVVTFIHDIVDSFSDISEKKSISLSVNSAISSLVMYFDPDKLEKILFNLLSNAFKFTGENGSVTVDVACIDKKLDSSEDKSTHCLEIKVKDTGIGIDKENFEKIFIRFFQNEIPGNMLNQGSGIGLALTKEFVKLHDGIITVESEPSKGSCFIVCIPVKTDADVLKNLIPIREVIAIDENTIPEPGNHETDLANTDKESKKPVLLLIEDNEDFRFYLKDNLKQLYQIAEAVNGQDGFIKAKNTIPDLIVSDIMMPVMDGIELCKKIKSDARTSHIPVILLTAKVSDDQIAAGYETGADDYITKPFNFEILLLRIRNLLTRRDSMRKAFANRIEINPSEITVTSLDEKLINKALTIVEKNMGNPDFSVEDLSKELGMSRVHLYKKLLSITGKSPIEFIRTIRLKRAAQLLKKSQLTISEIAYQVGFNNPKYFTKYFKNEFNIVPSQYIQENKEDGKVL